MDGLADGDERGQGVADHRELKSAEPALRESGEFEGKRKDWVPIDATGDGERHQNWDRERAVFAVAGDDCFGKLFFGAGVFPEPGFSARDGGGKFFGQAERGPDESGCREIGLAPNGVTPAPVGVLVLGEPSEAGLNEIFFTHLIQGDDGDGGGESAAAEFAGPVAGGVRFGEEKVGDFF